jgi:hypothetical protein
MVPAMAAIPAHSMSFDRRNLSVLLLEGVHPSAVELLAAEGYTQVVTHTKALPPAELAKALAGVHMLGIRSRTQLTSKELLAAAQKLMAIGCFCIGTNQVDLAAARRRGIPVFNAPFSNTRSVAELVLAEIILLMRGIPQKNAAAHRGELDQVGRRQRARLRGKHARHRRLRPHRHPGRRAGRGARHAGDLPRHRDQAGARQRAVRGAFPRHAAGDRRHRHAARAGDGADALDDRPAAARAHEAGLAARSTPRAAPSSTSTR